MIDNNTNQEKEEAIKNLHLHEIQPELIQAKTTLEKVLSKLCEGNAAGDALAKEIHAASGDSVTISIHRLGQVIKYLERIIANNQELIELLCYVTNK